MELAEGVVGVLGAVGVGVVGVDDLVVMISKDFSLDWTWGE